MNCPRCRIIIESSRPFCPQCGCDLTVSQNLAQLKETLLLTRLHVDQISRRIGSLEDTVGSIESAITREQQNQAYPIKEPITDNLLSNIKGPPGVAGDSAVPVPETTKANRPQLSQTETLSIRSEFLDQAAELKLGQRGLLIVGIVVFVLGVGYFLKYAFDRNWIGPAGRVALAYAGGFCGLGLGELFRRRGLATFGLYLCGGGIAVLYFSGYAAFQIYHLFSQSTAFALMILVTAGAGFLAIRHDNMWLAVLGIIGGFATPLVLSTGQDHQVSLMVYMVILNLGIVGIAVYKRWGLLNSLGFAATWILFVGWYERHYTPAKFVPTFGFLQTFFVIYALIPYLYYFLRNDPARLSGYVITVLNAAISFGTSYLIIRGFTSLEAAGLVSAAYSGLYFALGYALRQRNRTAMEPIAGLMAMGILFLIITVPIVFSYHWVTLFWSAQGLAMVWLFCRIGDTRLAVFGTALLLVGAVRYLAWDVLFHFKLEVPALEFANGYLHLVVARWVTIFAITAFLTGSAWLLSSGKKLTGDSQEYVSQCRMALCGLLGFFVFLVTNIETVAWFGEYAPGARIASISVLWALFAIVLMLMGFVRTSAPLRIWSLVLFGSALLKVFLVDMANIKTPYRIVSFLVLGVMLIGASYLYHRHRARLIGA